MRITKINKAKSFDITLSNIATDKSISHRSAMFALLCDKPSTIYNYLMGEDTLHSLQIAMNLGLQVKELDSGKELDSTMDLEALKSLSGNFIFTPPESILEPSVVLDCGNAGTGMRLFAGLLSGVKGHFVLSGDKYLNNRPMKRIIEPLQNIGANIQGRESNQKAPLSISGAKLNAFSYQSPIASAQVKSALILAALNANGTSTFIEPSLSRDHSENMLKGMGADISTSIESNGAYKVIISPIKRKLDSLNFSIPADPSSAFYFAVAACVCGGKVELKNVLLNKSRIQAFKVLEQMGAKVSYNRYESSYEDIGDIVVESRQLKGIRLDSHIAWLIDEIPALAICFAIAEGKSSVHNARELRVKESDRIYATISNLSKMGIKCEEYEDGFCIEGGKLQAAKLNSFGDHRIAMSFAIACLVCGGEIEDSECIDVSFPKFLELLRQICEVQNVFV